MLTQNGDSGHGVAMGNATLWDNTIAAHISWGYTINGTPAVGSIAQWEGDDANPNSSPGHVAYVEAVSGNTITVSEDNVILGGVPSYRWRTITTTGDWPTRFLHIKDVSGTSTADTDSDGTADGVDVLPTIAGPVSNRGVPIQTSKLGGDFNGDGKQDIALFYSYAGSTTNIFVLYGTGSGNFASPSLAWSSGTGGWDWNNTKPVVGDFNNDGVSDIAAFYGYATGQVKLWVFSGSTTGSFSTPTVKWDSGTNNWEWNRIQPLVGDFNGDGKQDVTVFYDYTGTSRLFTLLGDGAGNFATPIESWYSGLGNWQWQNTKPVTGDFNGDGKTDIMVFYAYSGDQTKVWGFFGTSTAVFADPTVRWDSGAGNLAWDRLIPFAGDFNGDGKQDLAILYGYTGSTSKLFSFDGDGTGSFPSAYFSWASGTGNWEWSSTKAVVGDFNADGKSDIGAFYGYFGSRTVVYEFNGSSTGAFSGPSSKWDSGAGGMDLSRVLLP